MALAVPPRLTKLAFMAKGGGPEKFPSPGSPLRLGKSRMPGAVAITFRIFALLLIMLAIFLLGADLLTTLEKQGQLTVRSIAQDWAAVNPVSLDAFRAWAGRFLSAGSVDSVLSVPGWGVSGVVGVLIAFLCGRPRGLKA